MTPAAFIGLENPKSPSNVGAVLRAAGCFGVAEIFYTGSRYARSVRFHTDTHAAGCNIPLTGVESLAAARPEQAAIVCVELVEGATALPEFLHPEQALYLFGPEDGTLSQELVDGADAVVYIPTIGCLNLAATVNVLLYDRQTKLCQGFGGDELIRSSRDQNNRVRVK